MYEYHRNKVTAANNWFNNRANIGREPLIRNQYGASVGGPIVKNRAFFFVNWEDRKDRSASAVSRDVPTETYKQGIVRVRMSNGQIADLSPEDIRAVDPLHIGISPYMLQMLNQYPVGNDPQSGSDRGLNFSKFRFNAPQNRDDRALVGKFDFNFGDHTLMFRATLADASRDQTVAQFPGQDAAVRVLDTSKGISARYTTVLSPSLVNVFSYGYTRLNVAQSGNSNPQLSFGGVTALEPNDRAFSRVIPTSNFVNDLTWVKDNHTAQFGVNLRMIQNDRTSYQNAYPTYQFSRNTLRGLGADITAATQDFLRARYGDSTLRPTEATPLANAFGTALGVINSYRGTYNFGRDGLAVPAGEPTVRSFAAKEYEFYIQDTWKVKPDLTLTYGMRYSIYSVPYEKNGVQVVSTTPLETYWAERIYASQMGIPGNAMPNAKLTYALGGAANDATGWFKRDNNNFAPRLSIAYAPQASGLMAKLFGQGSVLRAGAAVLYDRYGSDMVVNFDRTGSPGLSTEVTQPVNTDFTTSFRYTGAGLPALPGAPSAVFPFTPPTIIGGFTSNTSVQSDLVAPYSILLNLSYTRPIYEQMTVELGYIGRLARKGLLQRDSFQALTEFKDNLSGQTWAEGMGMLRDYFEAGVTSAQVRANPSMIAPIPFIENIFPRAAGLNFAGSATANYFFTTYGTFAGSDLDALSAMDRDRQPDGSCISVYGCNTFFAMQNAGMRTWVNAGMMNMHGGQVVIRKPISRGWGFDFNYTLSHAIDIESGAEAGAGANGALIQNSFNPSSSRASSDFDIRHNISGNTVLELPFGAGKPLLTNAPGWLEHIVGGWQVSALTRYRSGMPVNITNGGVYPTNYLSAALALLRPGTEMPETGVGYDQNGNPSIFRNTNAVRSFMGQYPGRTGSRGIIRGPHMFNTDMSLSKTFPLPIEGHRIQFRAEAFNAFNNVNFSNPTNMSLANTATFGQLSTASDARVMQFALRYEF